HHCEKRDRMSRKLRLPSRRSVPITRNTTPVKTRPSRLRSCRHMVDASVAKLAGALRANHDFSVSRGYLPVNGPAKCIITSMALPLVLASQSPRRKELLEVLGIPFSVVVSTADETVRSGESPEAYVARVARAKGQEV